MKTGIEGENFEVKEYGLLNAIRFRTTTYALCGSNECASPDFDDAVLHQAFDVIVLPVRFFEGGFHVAEMSCKQPSFWWMRHIWAYPEALLDAKIEPKRRKHKTFVGHHE